MLLLARFYQQRQLATQQQLAPIQQRPMLKPPPGFRKLNPYMPSPYVPFPPIYPDPPTEEITTEKFCARQLTSNNTDVKSAVDNIRIIMVVDETGSMRDFKSVTIDSFNEWMQKQIDANLEQEAEPPQMSLIKFDTRYAEQHWPNIKNAKNAMTSKNYNPSGGTALYDALVCTLEAYKHEKTNIVVIITDGLDNQSRRFSSKDAKQRIDDLTKNSDWSFSYIGANQNPIKVSKSLGIDRKQTVSYDFSNSGFKSMYNKLSSQVSQMRLTQSAKRMNGR
jgi:hypothetical protein